MPEPTAESDIAGFLEMIAAERGAAQNTVEAYRRDLEHFASFLDRHGLDLRSAAAADLAHFARELAAARLAPPSRARRVSAVRQLYKFLSAEGLVAEDPARRLSGPRQPRSLP